MNNLFGTDVNEFNINYPGVYDVYKKNCDIHNSTGDQKTKCCQTACNVCKTTNCNGGIDSCMLNCPPDDFSNEGFTQMKNNVFGTDVSEFNTNYPGVYDVYKENCNMPNPSSIQKTSCCQTACNVCNTTNCNGGVSSCMLNCPPDDFNNIPTSPQNNSVVFNKCVGSNVPGRCPRDQSIQNCYTQGCKNDNTCIDDNLGWFQNFCDDEGDWPGHTNVPPVSPDIPPYGPTPYNPKPIPVQPKPSKPTPYNPKPRPVQPKPSKPKPSKPTPSKPTPSDPSSSKPLSQSGLFSNLSTPQIVGVSIGGIIILVLIVLIIVKLMSNKRY